MKEVIAVLALLAIQPSYAIVDTMVEWEAVEVKATVDNEGVSVIARADKENLKFLAVRLRDTSIVVPQEELAGVPPVGLRTIRVISPDVKGHRGPTLRVEFETASTGDPDQVVAVVRLHFSELSYQGRLIELRKAGKVVVRESKLPGQSSRSEQ